MDFCTDEKEEFFPYINNIGETLKDADKKELEDLIDKFQNMMFLTLFHGWPL